MAEAKPADPTRPAEGSARVVPLAARPQPGHAERDGVSWNAFWIAAALLVFACGALIVQTQRVSSLSEQVEGLEVQLSAANAQLESYDRQLSLIRSTVASVVDQVTNLSELVQTKPLTAAPAPEAPAAD